MNKFILALLLVCLISVSVQAFVKRDAPEAAATNNNTPDLNTILKEIQDFGKAAGEKIQENINPEKVKDALQELSKKIEEGLNQLKGSSTPAP